MNDSHFSQCFFSCNSKGNQGRPFLPGKSPTRVYRRHRRVVTRNLNASLVHVKDLSQRVVVSVYFSILKQIISLLKTMQLFQSDKPRSFDNLSHSTSMSALIEYAPLT